jgi:hypothetical protein
MDILTEIDNSSFRQKLQLIAEHYKVFSNQAVYNYDNISGLYNPLYGKREMITPINARFLGKSLASTDRGSGVFHQTTNSSFDMIYDSKPRH